MQVTQQLDDNKVLVEMTQDEAVLMGCLEDAWRRATKAPGEAGPPGSFWHHNVQIGDALKAVAAWTELGARVNGLRLVLDDLDGIMRETPKSYPIWSVEMWVARLFWLAVGASVAVIAGAVL